MSALTLILLALGLGLIAFGAIVLLRYSDRPGGTVKWLGLELSSAGAGLPLIALGIGCIVLVVLRGPAASADRTPRDAGASGAASGDSGQRAAAVPGDSAARAASSDCLEALFASLPRDRVATVEAGMRALQVIGPHQLLDSPFGVVLTENGERIGAIRLRLYRGTNASADLYKVEAIVDAACQPVQELRNASRGGNPRELVNWDTLRMRLGGHDYEMRIGGEGDIGVGHFHRAS
jgi:hypothetical protein